MKLLFFLLFLLLAILLTWGISVLIGKLAHDRKSRFQHIHSILTLLLFVPIFCNEYTASAPIRLLDWVINHPKLLDFFNSVFPNRSYSILYMLLMFVGLNFLMALLALLIALIDKFTAPNEDRYIRYKDLTSLKDRIIYFYWIFINIFYEEKDGDICLKPIGFSCGRWARGMKYAFGALWLIQLIGMSLLVIWGSKEWNTALLSVTKSIYLLPAAIYFLLQQIDLFLDADLKFDAGSYFSANINTRTQSALETLKKLYHSAFEKSDVLILSDYHIENSLQGGLGANRLGNQQILDCKHPELLKVISHNITQAGTRLTETYKNALVALLNGSGINVCDHFEGEFSVYLCGYINFFLSQGKTVLVLCPSKDRVDQVAQSMNSTLRKLNNLSSIWCVNTLSDPKVDSQMNVLVCTPEELVQQNVLEKHLPFASEIFCTILVDGHKLLSRDCLRIHRLFGALHALKNNQQYILFTEGDNDSLRTMVEQVTATELLPFHNNRLPGGMGLMVWKEESCYRLQRQLELDAPTTPYMGSALPLAIYAAKYDIDRAYLVEDPSRADCSYWDQMTKQHIVIQRFLKKNTNLQSIFRRQKQEILTQPGDKMIIAYDTVYNFYHTLGQWAKYGGKESTLIHIISPSYMLREYFAAHYHNKRLLLRNTDFDPLVSCQQSAKATRMAVMLINLCNGPVSEEELMHKSREYGWNYDNLADLLRDCLRLVLTNYEIHSVFSLFRFSREKIFVPETDSFQTRNMVCLSDSTIRDRLERTIALAKMVNNGQRTDLSILQGNIYNYYLRDQSVAINGHCYHINSIVDGNIHVSQQTPQTASEYLQLCDFEFENYHQVDSCVDSPILDINLCSANVRRKIYGYWKTERGNCFGDMQGIALNDLRGNTDGIVAQFDNANVLEINIDRKYLQGQEAETVRLFAYTLKELFKTLFPYNHQNLFAAVRQEECGSYAIKVMDAGEDRNLDDAAASLIPAVLSGLGEARSDRISLYIIEASCIEYGMVKMIYERRSDIFHMLLEYLQWYQASATASQETEQAESTSGEESVTDFDFDNFFIETQDSDRSTTSCSVGKYLHFGSENIPSVFDFDGLLHLCTAISPTTANNEPAITEPSIPIDMKVCSFCGAETLQPKELIEGRHCRLMCSNCSENQLTAEEEVNNLYYGVFASMERDYNIKFPHNLSVRFQTAEAIYQQTGIGDGNSRVLGFFYAAGNQLWLEARGPEVAMHSTLFHELTHAWQHYDKAFIKSLNKALRAFPLDAQKLVKLLLLEGHAVYVEINGMIAHNQYDYADRLRHITYLRQDEYGIGYRFVGKYLYNYQAEGSHMTPFVAMQRLVDDIAQQGDAFKELYKIIHDLMEA